MMKTIGISMGDPLGIGAEIILKALPKFRGKVNFLVFGDRELLRDLPLEELEAIDVVKFPRLTPEWAGKSSVAYLDAAMLAYEHHKIQALVTAPIAKHHVKLAGFPFPGHTEYLAAKTNTPHYVMMMAGPKLKVSLVTIHEPLARVPSLLSVDKIVKTIEITYKYLRFNFNILEPKIAVCGLNPHAGEKGILGREEIDIIEPAIKMANKNGWLCAGPQVPDAVFHEAYAGKWDGVICMYHDQGLIPFKMVHFQDGVNVTLGLPLVRTSPDHGTAFDIAGQGKADSSSMESAINLAIRMMGEEL